MALNEDQVQFKESSRPVTRSKRKEVVLIVLSVAAVVVLYYLLPVIVIGLAQPVKVAGNTMAPTLNDGDRILLNKRVGDLQRGDIVVFWYPEDETKSFIKRIVGLPGETIDLDSNDNITINGTMIDEPYIQADRNREARRRWKMSNSEWKTIKDGFYFVMGDNRDFSNDSRTWGCVPRSLIYGKVMFRYWRASSD